VLGIRFFDIAPRASRAYNPLSTTTHTDAPTHGAFSLNAGSNGLSAKPKVLWIDTLGATPVAEPTATSDSPPASIRQWLEPGVDWERVDSPLEALVSLQNHPHLGLFLTGTDSTSNSSISLLESERVLDALPDGVALVDAQFKVLWANQFLHRLFPEGLLQTEFYQALGQPELIGTEGCPLHTATSARTSCSNTLHTTDNRFFQIHVAPLMRQEEVVHLVITLNDVTAEVLQQQKLAAIHKAGSKLADLKPDEIFEMGVDQRIELLKDNIRHYTHSLLNVDVIEIRLLEQSTGNLIPLLSVGIDQEAADRKLFACPQGNGVTGYVASTGRSYLCQDTRCDNLYLQAFDGAASSLTVPILLHDSVIGTINIESPKPHAFNDSDRQFLEIFARDIAMSLNTLELLVAQKTNAAQESCEAIHSAVALPVDDILLDAVNVMERYIGHDPDVVQRLQRILKNARDIKRVIQQVGQKMAPVEAVPIGCTLEQHAKLRGKRVLVVDADEQVRNDAHGLLERYGCTVETAHHGDEAVMMVKAAGTDAAYDVIISDIRLPDYSGYQLMLRLKNILEPVPMVLMTGFGYDPGHSIVKARQAGLHSKAILYKPFRLDQLISVVETIIDNHQPQHA
jgi:CheY-like chemotaxis protein